jgi:GTP-binding protein YchF
MLRAGIIGLPNAGKSTLFNAVTRTHKAAVASYPFCTIEPNVGVVAVPDPRLAALAAVFKTPKQIPAAVEFFDIAGLVKGAAQGEGLGNKFLSHIREVDALIEVVRCFEDPDVPHPSGTLDPVRDIEIITTELVLADMEALRKHHDRIIRDVRRGDKAALAQEALVQKLTPHLDAGKPAVSLRLPPEERALLKSFFLLSDKPILYAANLGESDMPQAQSNPHCGAVRAYAQAHHQCGTAVVSARLESELADLTDDEATEYLKELGVAETGGAGLIQSVYRLLGLRTFFSHNETEVRAWTIHEGDTAVTAAGVIHTDFARGFIKAEVVPYQDLVASGSVARARETGHYRIEGKDYVVGDGDVIHFRFSV